MAERATLVYEGEEPVTLPVTVTVETDGDDGPETVVLLATPAVVEPGETVTMDARAAALFVKRDDFRRPRDGEGESTPYDGLTIAQLRRVFELRDLEAPASRTRAVDMRRALAAADATSPLPPDVVTALGSGDLGPLEALAAADDEAEEAR